MRHSFFQLLSTSLLSGLWITWCAAQQTPPSWAKIPQESESATRAFSSHLRGELASLRDAAMHDDYAYKELEHLTDSIGPRTQGSAQADAAVHYVADELRKLGMEVHLEPVPVQQFLRGNDTAELVEYPGQVAGARQKIVLTALYGNAPTPPEGITGELIVVHTFDELKALGREKVAGKIVLFNERFDSKKAMAGRSGEAYGEVTTYRGEGAIAAARVGAIASLVRSAGDGAYRLPHTGWSDDAHIPAAALTAEDSDLIERLAAKGAVKIHLSLPTRVGPTAQSYNVVADLKGSEHPEQVVVVSGHIDSWDLGTGAIDDGAGVAVAMETAELIHQLKLHPRRTIRVIAWMNEEAGASGREAYAHDHAAEMANHFAAIESDLGAEHPLGFVAKISPAANAELAPVQEALRPIGANLIQLVAESPATDIEPLAGKGVPALAIWQNGLKYFTFHHTAADTLDKIVPEELRENAACMAVMGYALAQMEGPLAK
jgi:Zn-dependent M28 family amino/carboxypeptidase